MYQYRVCVEQGRRRIYTSYTTDLDVALATLLRIGDAQLQRREITPWADVDAVNARLEANR